MRVVTTLPLQLRNSYLRLAKFRPVRNQAHPWMKPDRNTGLWTSTWNPQTKSSGWTEWCQGEDYHTHALRWGYVYRVSDKLRILEINNQDDLREIIAQFPSHWSVLPEHEYIDFEAVARAGYHAIHLTDAGQWATRLPVTGPDLYGWDCESTLWLKLNRNTLTFNGKIRLSQFKGPHPSRRQLRDAYQSSSINLRRLSEEMKQWKEVARAKDHSDSGSR